MGVISVIHSQEAVKVTGLRDNVRRVARSIEFYNDYVTKLDSIESKIRQEKQQFEQEKHSFAVPQNLVGLIIGKQGVNKKAIQEKYGIKIYAEDSADGSDAIIHLSGKDISILQTVQMEIELQEKNYSVPDNMVGYLVGPKFVNITTFKEKAGLMILVLLKREGAHGQP